jgi:hypothetical protein
MPENRYKELSDLNTEEYDAYLTGYNAKLYGYQTGTIKKYDHNLYMCFTDGWTDATQLLIEGDCIFVSGESRKIR